MFLLLTRYHYWLDNITYNYYICIILYVYLHPNIYIYNIFYNRNLKNRKTIYKLRWYPQQPRRFIFTNLSEACCEAKRWKPSAEPVEPDPALHQRFPKPSFPQPSPEPVEPDLALHQSLRNLHRNLHRKPVEPDLALHQSLPDLLRNPSWNPVEPDLVLHQSLSDLLRNSRSPVEPDRSAPKPPTPSPEPSEPSPEPR